MAVKTITIDLEAYEELAKRKRPNESFSQVIKRTFADERYTAKHLLESLSEVALSDETLDRIEAERARNEAEYPEECPDLG
jgi:predicted CopG family antitoxin